MTYTMEQLANFYEKLSTSKMKGEEIKKELAELLIIPTEREVELMEAMSGDDAKCEINYNMGFFYEMESGAVDYPYEKED